MKKIIYLLFASVIGLGVHAQTSSNANVDTTQLRAGIMYVNKQVASLSEMGVESKGDSLIVSEEVMKLLKDEHYRKSVYPAEYKWTDAMILFKNMELKRAFWHLINLYDTDKDNRKLIISVFCAYDTAIVMDKALMNTFYTYALSDPRVCRITNDKPDIFRPDLLEQWARNLKEILAYISYYREQINTAKK